MSEETIGVSAISPGFVVEDSSGSMGRVMRALPDSPLLSVVWQTAEGLRVALMAKRDLVWSYGKAPEPGWPELAPDGSWRIWSLGLAHRRRARVINDCSICQGSGLVACKWCGSMRPATSDTGSCPQCGLLSALRLPCPKCGG